jgi:hypothetical protein
MLRRKFAEILRIVFKKYDTISLSVGIIFHTVSFIVGMLSIGTHPWRSHPYGNIFLTSFVSTGLKREGFI